MGRTLKSFRIAVGEEELRWERAGRKLTSVHRESLTDVLRSARLYASASSMAVRTTVFEAFFMAMLFDSYKDGTCGT
jgi:hypothetical protein